MDEVKVNKEKKGRVYPLRRLTCGRCRNPSLFMYSLTTMSSAASRDAMSAHTRHSKLTVYR